MPSRVLVTSTPGVGHLHPLVPIARELQRRGHELRWITAPGSVGRVAGYGFDARPGGVDIPERMQRFLSVDRGLAGMSPREQRPTFFSGFFAEIAAPMMHAAVASAVDDFRPDVIVHEFCELAAAPVARAHDIGHATVAFSGAPDPAMMQAARGPLAATWSAEGLDVPDDLGLFDDLYLHPWPEALGCRPHAENTVDSWHMGFDGGDADPPPWVYSLGADRPCVYVSFGTEVGRLAPWPAILAALGALDVDGVITTGQGIDLSEHGTVPPNVRVETYVPQGYVLDRASLMVTHAGAGAVAAALERSLPHLCLPIAADQWENADACAAAGIASRLEPDARSADDVGHAISTLLTDAMVLQRCRRVRHQVATMPAVTDAADRVEALVV